MIDLLGTVFESHVRVRSYELDALGHANHSVFFNYMEQARFDALEQGGLPASEIARRGWSIVVVRAEADFKREALQGDLLTIRTRVESVRRTRIRIAQEIVREEDGVLVAGGAVVLAWLGRDRRPIPVPDEALDALGARTASSP